MKKLLCVFLFLLNIPTWANSPHLTGLSAKWQKWLDEEVVYIISEKEKTIFLELKTEREREAFEKAFWLQRDPTPGTEANEFREEHFKRLRYVNATFGRGTFKRGWETDRGKVFMVLGNPIDIERFDEGTQNLLPSELWFYHGDTSLGLPPFFYVLFFKKEDASGDLKFYSPSFDGPQRLIRKTVGEETDRYSAYQQLMKVSPELGQASISLIPGSGEDPLSPTSSLSSDTLLSNIQNLPQKKLKNEWVEAFAKNKEIITTDYSVDYVQSRSAFFIHQENNRNYLHFVMEPFRFDMARDEQKAFAELKLNAKISDAAGSIIHQEEKDIQIGINPNEIKKFERKIIAIGDIVPLVEGQFTVSFLLRNTLSKAFSSVEEKVTTPPPGVTSLSPILFLYNEKKAAPREAAVSFLINDSQLYPNTQKIYSKSDDVTIFFEIYNPSAALQTSTLTLTIRDEKATRLTRDEIIGNQRVFLRKYPLKDFPAANYQVLVSIAATTEGQRLASASEFQVTPMAAIPRPLNYNKIYPPFKHSYFSMIRAYQYMGLKKYDRVIEEIVSFYEKAKPNKDIAALLAQAYYSLKDFRRVVEILDSLKDTTSLEILVLLGKSHYQLADYSLAIEYFGKALAAQGEILEILNLLGFSYLKNGQSGEALKYFNKSLQLNPDQPDISQIIKKNERRTK